MAEAPTRLVGPVGIHSFTTPVFFHADSEQFSYETCWQFSRLQPGVSQTENIFVKHI